MFRTFARRFLPNPLDWMLSRASKKGAKKILLGWNRGLGDLALGLYAIIHRIREKIPDAEIVFLTRENLRDGFAMLEGVQTLIAPSWQRGQPADVRATLRQMGIDPKQFDLILERPSPSDWVTWQRGNLTPKLKWNPVWDSLHEKFGLSETNLYIGVQAVAETNYGLWRNWPISYWIEFFSSLERWKNVKILLFGFGDEPKFDHSNVIDLRGRTTLHELLSVVKNRCAKMILPDSGILSMIYYLDASFPIEIFSLWADPNHGILKQAVASPNPQLVHCPIVGEHRDLGSVSPQALQKLVFPVKPLYTCMRYDQVEPRAVDHCAAIILAGGQGSRLGVSGPKGTVRVAGKSLFQWICEKAPKENFPIAVMTSPLNHKETVAFFEQHAFFNREIYFFEQGMHPVLDEKKRPFASIQGLSALAPDGNGSVFSSFVRSGMAQVFSDRGVQTVAVVPVENPMAHPADPYLLTYHRDRQSEVTIKCVSRIDQNESMGAVAIREGKIEIIEYTENDGSLEFSFSYTGMMALDLGFIERMEKIELPLHWVWKQFPAWGSQVWGWKGERFIFDALKHADRVEALQFPREICYAPVKGPEHLERLEQRLVSL